MLSLKTQILLFRLTSPRILLHNSCSYKQRNSSALYYSLQGSNISSTSSVCGLSSWKSIGIHLDPDIDPAKKKSKSQKQTKNKSSPEISNEMASSSLLSSPIRVEQVYDYLLVLDFEATCDKDKTPEPQVRTKDFYFF